MRKTIYIFIFAVFVSACEQRTSTSEKKEADKSIKISIESEKKIKPTEKLTRIDSIDKANNEIILVSGNNVTKAFIFLKDGDSTVNLIANIRQDHRIFGYASPDIKSEKLLLLSVFTSDVDNNPFGCKLGAYYDTSGMNGSILKYASATENFVEVTAIDPTHTVTTLYFEKKWVDIE